jgi:hypothetical protein
MISPRNQPEVAECRSLSLRLEVSLTRVSAVRNPANYADCPAAIGLKLSANASAML